MQGFFGLAGWGRLWPEGKMFEVQGAECGLPGVSLEDSFQSSVEVSTFGSLERKKYLIRVYCESMRMKFWEGTAFTLLLSIGFFLELVQRVEVNGQVALVAKPFRALMDLVCLRKIFTNR